jgi:uncharacterized membrane protein YphA (DoxX/SURF4 family)
MRIELDDSPPSLSLTLGSALLRLVLGGVAILDGLQKFAYPQRLASQLSQLGVPEAASVTAGVYGCELTLGLMLCLGRYTRSAAFLLGCDRLASAGCAWLLSGPPSLAQLEGLLLSIACCVLFLLSGGGHFSLDHFVRQRRRLRALARDALWSRPPYVRES